MSKKEMSNLETIMCALIEVFHKYSGKEGDKYTLTKGELKTLMQTELGDVLDDSKDPAEVDKILKGLDANKDGVVDFQEFIVLFACLTMLCHKFFQDCNTKDKQSCGKSSK